MVGKPFTEEERRFRKMLRSGVCKPRLARWFQDAGLTEAEKDILYRTYIKGQSKESIANETYRHVGTISSKSSVAIRKLMDYFKYSGIDELGEEV